MALVLGRTTFNFSKEISKPRSNIMVKEYMRLRSVACDRINPCFERWNSEYTGKTPGDDIYSEESREYNDYIRSKMEPILRQVNKEVRTAFTYIAANEVCDLIGVSKRDPRLILSIDIEYL